MSLSRKTEIYEIKIQCRKLNVSKVFRCFLGLCAVRASGFGRAAVQQRSWNAESTVQFNWMLSHRLEFCWKFKLVFEFRCFLQFDLIFSSSDLLRFFFLFFLFFLKKKSDSVSLIFCPETSWALKEDPKVLIKCLAAGRGWAGDEWGYAHLHQALHKPQEWWHSW